MQLHQHCSKNGTSFNSGHRHCMRINFGRGTKRSNVLARASLQRWRPKANERLFGKKKRQKKMKKDSAPLSLPLPMAMDRASTWSSGQPRASRIAKASSTPRWTDPLLSLRQSGYFGGHSSWEGKQNRDAN